MPAGSTSVCFPAAVTGIARSTFLPIVKPMLFDCSVVGNVRNEGAFDGKITLGEAPGATGIMFDIFDDTSDRLDVVEARVWTSEEFGWIRMFENALEENTIVLVGGLPRFPGERDTISGSSSITMMSSLSRSTAHR